MAHTLLPIALGIIMLGLGLSLTVDDFKRAAKQPRPILIGLGCQVILLPALCFGLVLAFNLQNAGNAGPYLAAGMMLLAASPGGATAAMFSHLFRGDVALNISLLAINSVLSVLTLPIVVNLSFLFFLQGDKQIGLQTVDTLQVFAIVLVPVAIGMVIRHRWRDFAKKMDRPVRIASVVILVGVVIGALISNGREIMPHLGSLVLIAIVFCLANLTVGYVVPRLLRVGKPQATALSMEIGVHNETLAITIGLSVLGEPRLAVPAATYSLIKFAIIPIFGWVITRRDRHRFEQEVTTATPA